MSQVARVFVFLNLVIAAGFLFAASTFLALNNDWKAQFDAKDKDHKALVVSAKAEQDRLSSELAQVKTDLQAAQVRRDQLETANTDLDQEKRQLVADLATKDRQIAELTTANNEHAATIERMRSDVNAKQEKVDEFEAEARQATRDALAATSAKDEAEKVADGLRDTIRDLEGTVATQSDKIEEMGLVIANAISQGYDVTMMAASPVEARVTNYDPALRLVQINKGSNDKVTRGSVIDIVRGANYIGRMRVDMVLPTHCAGLLIVPEQGADVRVGDRATNQLN